MKIQSVSPKVTSLNRKALNMKGFGSDIETKENSQDNNLSKGNFLGNVSFKGHTEEFYNCGGYICGTSGAVHTGLSDPILNVTTHDERYRNIHYNYPQLSGYYSDDRLEEKLIYASYSFYPNSSVEKTDKYRTGYVTHRVYFADPDEEVSEQTKKDHDYIVYDNRPVYPTLESMKKNYFFDEKYFDDDRPYYYRRDDVAENFAQHFSTIQEYYERREEADLHEYFRLKKESRAINKDNNEKIDYYAGKIEDSRNHQRIAKEGHDLLDSSGFLFIEKDELKNKIKFYKDELVYIPKDIENLKALKLKDEEKLSKTEKFYNAQKVYIEMKEAEYMEQGAVSRNYWESDSTYKERNKKAIEEKLAPLKKQCEEAEANIENLKAKIEETKQKIENQKQRFASIQEDLPKADSRFREVLGILSENYKKLEEFYRNNIQEWQMKQ